MGDDKPIKKRNYMYEQQIAHLPNGMSPDDLYTLVDEKLNPKRWAGITHNRDFKEDGKTPAEDHVHLMMQFENARYLNSIAETIGDRESQLQIWDKKVSNGFSYLIHSTEGDRHKHQYSCDEVTANFDYKEYIKNVSNKVAKAGEQSSASRVNGILDSIGTGRLSYKEAKNLLTGSEYASYANKLKKAHELYLERRADELFKDMEENGELVSVHWFYGKSETGKTFLAEKLAKECGEYYKTSNMMDPFNYYQAEPIILLDELRPDTIPYSELLAMFDPFSRCKVVASSRYYNRPLACKTFFVTTPLDPKEFCSKISRYSSDHGKQLFRRLSSVLKFTADYIYMMKYDEKKNRYSVVKKKTNPYSMKNQTGYTLNNVFDKI